MARVPRCLGVGCVTKSMRLLAVRSCVRYSPQTEKVEDSWSMFCATDARWRPRLTLKICCKTRIPVLHNMHGRFITSNCAPLLALTTPAPFPGPPHGTQHHMLRSVHMPYAAGCGHLADPFVTRPRARRSFAQSSYSCPSRCSAAHLNSTVPITTCLLYTSPSPRD